jgi:CubicO group peptidase (beta-lactamase class C family)
LSCPITKMKKKLKSVLAIVCLAIMFTSCQKEVIVINTSSKADVLKVIEAEKGIQDLNSVSFCVVKEDSLLWTYADGYADKEAKKLATTDTRYLIASVSKAVTAVAVMKLVEQNKLLLDEDINTYLPFQVRNPNFPNNPITTRMLLNHSASISDAHYANFDFYSWNVDCPTPLGAFLNDFFSTNGQFYSPNSFYKYTPGLQGNYTNMGYALLGYMVERAANQPFDEYCKQHLFLPLAMTKTEWRLKNTPISDLAIPYSPTQTSSTPHYTFPDYPNGGIRTTPTDISKFMRMLMNEGVFNGSQILSNQTIDLIKTRTLTLNRGGLSFDFGLGLYYTSIKGTTLYGHGGGEQGTSTAMHFDPTTKVGVVVFTNTTSANLDLIIYTLYKYGLSQ